MPSWVLQDRVLRLLRGAVLPMILVVMWEGSARWTGGRFETLSRPSEVLAAAAASLADGSVLLATWQTVEAALFGLALAIAAGIGLGTLIGASRMAERAARPTVEALRPIPAVALIPLTLLLFGYGLPMEGLVVAYACVWPILIATADGVRRIEPRLIEVAQALEMTPIERLRHILLPAALGPILVGIRIAAAFALVVAVTVEITVNPRGLGYSLIVAQQKLEIGRMYAQLLWLGLLGLAINALISRMGGTGLGRGMEGH